MLSLFCFFKQKLFNSSTGKNQMMNKLPTPLNNLSTSNEAYWMQKNQDFDKSNEIQQKIEMIDSLIKHSDLDGIYSFVQKRVFEKTYMEIIYHFYRLVLAKSRKNDRFKSLEIEIREFYKNEIIDKMKRFFDYKQSKKQKEQSQVLIEKQFQKATLLCGDNLQTLPQIKDKQVSLVFTSPPYYNAREYSDYTSYQCYLDEMKKVFLECYRVLEDGRMIVVNISPIIIPRVSREYESTRYPIHFDFHRLLVESGFSFIDEIIWIKPEASVPNRVGGYLNQPKPLGYKPNAITESILVYRKNADFLLDENIKKYTFESDNDFESNTLDKIDIDTTNCWYINPTRSKDHPAVFPSTLCEKVLKYYSYPQDVVLDPFGGIGTFGHTAIIMNRIPILCERDSSYIDKIVKAQKYDVFGNTKL